MKKRIYVLGAGGFVGRKLQEHLLGGKYDLTGYFSSDCNLLSRESIDKGLSNLSPEDIIVMISSITRLRENSLESMAKNITMASNIAEFINKNPISQFVFLSTTDVYGLNPIIPLNEKSQLNPADYYSSSKLSSELILRATCSSKDIPLLTLRLSGLYGWGDEGRSTINKLVKSAKEGKIVLSGNGEDRRDFVYVEDICKIIERGIEEKVDATINVATGKSYSIKKMSEFIRKYFKETQIEYKEETGKKERAKDLVFDISLLRKTFPRFKFTNVKKGIRLYIRNT